MTPFFGKLKEVFFYKRIGVIWRLSFLKMGRQSAYFYYRSARCSMEKYLKGARAKTFPGIKNEFLNA